MAAAGPQQITERKLLRLAESDRQKFYALAAQYGFQPGPGKKISYLVRQIVEASGGEAAEVSTPESKPRVTARVRPGRPARSVASQAARGTRPAGAPTAGKPAGAVAVEGETNVEVLRSFFMTLGKSLIEAAESLEPQRT